MVHMHRVEFGAARQRRNRLTRIQQFQRIEAFANRMKLVALGFTELDTHFPELFDTNAGSIRESHETGCARVH